MGCGESKQKSTPTSGLNIKSNEEKKKETKEYEIKILVQTRKIRLKMIQKEIIFRLKNFKNMIAKIQIITIRKNMKKMRRRNLKSKKIKKILIIKMVIKVLLKARKKEIKLKVKMKRI